MHVRSPHLVALRAASSPTASVVAALNAAAPAAPAAGIGTARGRRTRRPGQVHLPVAAAPTPAPRPRPDLEPAKDWERFPIGRVSKADGPFPVDWAKAHHDAQVVLDKLDFSKRDLVIWVPGTSCHGVHDDFDAAAAASWGAVKQGGASVVALEYEASWNLRTSVATGIATMKLVLREIARRGGDHQVLVAGESQGAWIAGEVIADPEVGKVVDRAVLMGHPWLAANQYTDGHDPRVAVINHKGDQVTLPVNGDVTAGLDAMIAIRQLNVTKIGTVLKALAQNPHHGVEMLKNIAYAIPFVKTLLVNPHVYGPEMTRVVEFLRYGKLDGSDVAESERATRRRLAAEALEAQRRMREAGLDLGVAVA